VKVDSTFEIITPADPAEEAVNFRFFCMEEVEFVGYLMQNGVITDWREQT
jgi:hypothetical protein